NEHEKNCAEKTANEGNMRSGQPRNRRAQAESDTASKRRGNRYSRKPHGARLRRTSVSMWYVCGKRSNRCISAISYRVDAGAASPVFFDPVSTARSRASVDGSHDRYTISA